MSSNKQIPIDMSVETAEKILKFAKAGLPIVFVGELPYRVTSYYGNQEDMQEEDKRLKQTLTSLFM